MTVPIASIIDPDEDAARPLDPDVERALVANHRAFLAFLRKRTGDSAMAEELLQTAYMKALEKGAHLRDGEGAVTWFYRLLRNALIDGYRRRTIEDRVFSAEPDEGFTEPDREFEDAVCQCVRALLPTLKEDYANLIERVDLEGRSVSELATELGLTPNNATVKLHRARQALKKQLERSCGTCATHGCLDCGCRTKAGSVTEA